MEKHNQVFLKIFFCFNKKHYFCSQMVTSIWNAIEKQRKNGC